MSLRIHRLDFKPWGCFEDLSLIFSATSGVVDLVEGPNAAGKSTISRGECALLHGIPIRTRDGHTYNYADLRIGGLLAIDGSPAEVVRRKAQARTLLHLDGQILVQDPIPAAIGGMNEDIYRALFQVNHDTLVKGGEELLQGRGEVGASLFAAAAGIVTLHDILAAFDTQADGIFKPRAHTTKLHAEVASLRDAEKRLRNATIRPAAHREMQKALEQAEAACENLSQEIRKIQSRVHEIERRRAAAPLLDDHAALSAELGDLSSIPDLNVDATERRVRAQTALRTGADQLGRVRTTASELGQRIAAITVDEDLLAHATEIRAANDDMSVVSKAASDRRKREGELREAQAGLRAVAATIGVQPDDIATLRRPVAARRALDAFVREHGEISERRRLARDRLHGAQARRDDHKRALEELEPATALDVCALEVSTRSAAKACALPAQLAEARAEIDRLTQEADIAFARLRPSPAIVDALSRLPVPSRDAILGTTTELTELRQLNAAIDAEKQRLAAGARELDEQREQLRLEGQAPTAHDLAAARTTRGQHWTKLRGAIDSRATVGLRLVDDFESALAESDRVADALTSDATKVERAANLEARALRLDLDGEALGQRSREHKQRRAGIEERWTHAWAATGLALIDAADAAAWMDLRDEIVDLVAVVRRRSSMAQALIEQIDTHTLALYTRLRELNIAVPEDLGLDELVTRAEAVIAEARHHATERATLSAALDSSERELAAAERELDDVESDWSAWKTAWPARRVSGGLPDAAEPEDAHEIVRAVEDGLAHTSRVADLTRKIDGIDRDCEIFTRKMQTLSAAVASDLAGLDPHRAAATLMRRLGDAESERTERENLCLHLGTVQDGVERIEDEVGAAQAEIADLLCLAACTDVADLAVVEQRARRARELRGEIGKLEQQIAKVGDGRFEDLRRDAGEFDRDAAAAELLDLHDRTAELTERRDQTKEQIGQDKQGLSAAEGDVSAITAAEDVELALARVRQLAVDCAKAKLSAAIVRRAIERYRNLHQDPLLLRANDLFTRFTYGDYKELFVDLDDKGSAYMVARRHDRVRHDVSQMSTGTREQLFLALRIAAIERYVEISAAAPVIFDDVFLESDEPRSERIFEALGELAAKTQVIVLTHHHHLIAIGKRALGDNLRVQELPGRVPLLHPAVAAA